MTVYDQVSKNKRRTFFIFFIVFVVISGFFYLLGNFFESPTTYFAFGLLFSIASGFTSYFFSDKIILFSLNAKPGDKKEYFDFYTTTENLAIAAGLPMPKLYVIEDQSPNALATGRDNKHAVVCATTGLLEMLNRRELEGVVGHELSHVKNYDILISSVVATLVGMIAIVSDWIMRNIWWGGFSRENRDQEDRNPLMIVFFILLLIVGPLVATLIQLAISRQREFLADSSSALLTRYPEGLAEALEKISANPYPLRNVSSATAHLFISNPFKKNRTTSWIINLFNTHPPVEERIRILRSM